MEAAPPPMKAIDLISSILFKKFELNLDIGFTNKENFFAPFILV